jgi:protein TonB
MKPQLLTLTLVCLFTCTQLFSQDTTGKHTNSIPHDTIKIPASFRGGDEAWKAYMGRKINTDVPVRKMAPPGNYVVSVGFLVGKDGTIQEVEILKDPGYGTAEEMLRVFKHAPKWNPATIDGKPVLYRQRQSFTFQVAEEKGRKSRG